MAGFIYFIDDDKPLSSVKQLEELGLAYAFDAKPTLALVRYGTPSGRPGWFACDEQRLGDCVMQYMPDCQTWRRFITPNGPDVWIGYYRDHPPGPADLIRDKALPGVDVELCDGNRWQVPIVYVYEGQQQRAVLPRYIDLNTNGELIPGEVLQQYAYLMEAVKGFWDAWVAAYEQALVSDDKTFVIDWKRSNEDAAVVLGANYHISLREVVALRLFQVGQSAGEVLRVACDCDAAALFLTYQFQQKKTECESLPIAAGHAA